MGAQLSTTDNTSVATISADVMQSCASAVVENKRACSNVINITGSVDVSIDESQNSRLVYACIQGATINNSIAEAQKAISESKGGLGLQISSANNYAALGISSLASNNCGPTVNKNILTGCSDINIKDSFGVSVNMAQTTSDNVNCTQNVSMSNALALQQSASATSEGWDPLQSLWIAIFIVFGLIIAGSMGSFGNKKGGGGADNKQTVFGDGSADGSLLSLFQQHGLMLPAVGSSLSLW